MPLLRLKEPHVLGGDVTVLTGDNRSVSYANFDVAASAPCATVAAEAVTALLPYYASVHRGAGQLSQRCTWAYEEAREEIADFLGCRTDDSVIFTRNTTDALNLLAHVVPDDVTVVCFDSEHHANLLPWRRAVRLRIPSSPAEAVAAVETALASIRGRALIAVTGASNVTGELWPISDIAAVARRYDARVVIDAAQLAPHRPIDIGALGIDYVALSGHKMYAPFGAGVLAGRADWLDAASPYLHGGGATRAVGYSGTGDVAASWCTGPARHEAGTPNLLGAVALAAVCRALGTADREALRVREGALLDRLRNGLAAIPGIRQLSIFDETHPRICIVAFVVAGRESSDVSRALARDHGIGVRDGLFCAHLLTRHLLTKVGMNTSTTAIRASFGLGTTFADVDRLVEAIAEINSRPTT